MAVSGSWRIYGSVTGLPTGTRAIDVSITVGTGVDYTTTVTTGGAGFNAFTVPTGYTAVAIIPAAGNAQSLTLKGVTGDTGIALSETQATVLTLATATLGITCGGACTYTLLWM